MGVDKGAPDLPCLICCADVGFSIHQDVAETVAAQDNAVTECSTVVPLGHQKPKKTKWKGEHHVAN
jgi:hypothetical protein